MSELNIQSESNINIVSSSNDKYERQYRDQVVFENVADQYVKGEDVTAQFTIIYDSEVNSNDDQIGLLRVSLLFFYLLLPYYMFCPFTFRSVRQMFNNV